MRDDQREDIRRRSARIPSSQIGYVNAIVESHEGIGILRTRDPKAGVVEFWVAPDFVSDFDRMIEGLREEMPIEFIEKDARNRGSTRDA